jgi:hypothetical protein
MWHCTGVVSRLKEYPKIVMEGLEDPVFVQLNEEMLKQHLAETINVKSLKQLTLKQRREQARKPLYLARYE